MDSYFGVIEEQTSHRDWLGSEIDLPRTPKGTQSFEKNGSIQYDQREVDNYSCTIHGAMTAYSALTGYEFTLEERKELWEKALEQGAVPGLGWYINKAVDLVRHYVNDREDLQSVSSYRVSVNSSDFLMAMRLGYVPVTGLRYGQSYKDDRDDDGIVQNTEFTSVQYGHCLSTAYSVGDEYDNVIDNYKPRSTNVYKVPSCNWRKLVMNRVFYSTAYIYILN